MSVKFIRIDKGIFFVSFELQHTRFYSQSSKDSTTGMYNIIKNTERHCCLSFGLVARAFLWEAKNPFPVTYLKAPVFNKMDNLYCGPTIILKVQWWSDNWLWKQLIFQVAKIMKNLDNWKKLPLGSYKDIIFSVKIMAPHYSCGKILHLDGVYLIFH